MQDIWPSSNLICHNLGPWADFWPVTVPFKIPQPCLLCSPGTTEKQGHRRMCRFKRRGLGLQEQLTQTLINSYYFLSVHHGPVPLLPSEPAALAELHPSLPQLQRLLCQSPADPGQAGQRILLGPAPKLRKHVRKRLLPKASKALQGKTSKELFNTYLSYSISILHFRSEIPAIPISFLSHSRTTLDKDTLRIKRFWLLFQNIFIRKIKT